MYWLARLFFTAAIGVRIPAWEVKFDIADLDIKVPSGGNRLFLCPLDVFPCPLDVLLCPLDVQRTVLTSTSFLWASDEMSCCQVKG